MGAECCIQGAFTGVSNAVSNEANDIKESSSEKANRHLDKLAGEEEKQEDKIDNAFSKVISTGNDLIFNSQKTIEQHKRDKIRKKNKKKMDDIKQKYKPQTAPPKQMSSKDRKKYDDLKTRLQG